MKKVYTVRTVFGNTFVVAESYEEAEKIFNSHYWPSTIKEISCQEGKVLLELKKQEDSHEQG